MYAIVKTGGKQYRIEQGMSLLVERLPVDEGARVSLEPLLYVDDSRMLDGEAVAKVKVEAKVLGHERGPKLRIVKFKPKRGYKRRTGHRQELTRLEVTSIKGPPARKPRAQADAADKPTPRRRTSAEKPAPRRRAPTAAKRTTTTKKKETTSDGS
jgi:large subunit ribosomal protein L21